MNKANFIKIAFGILFLLIIALSFIIFKNHKEGYGCTDCIIERTLTGKGYNGWQISPYTCKEYTFNQESSLQCFNSNLPWKVENIAQSEIKIPSIKIFNTVLASKNLPAFVIEGEGCRPSFAIIPDGSMFSKGGCLG